MAGLTLSSPRNAYVRDVEGGTEHWNPAVGRWDFRAASREVEEVGEPVALPSIANRAVTEADPRNGTVVQFLMNSGVNAAHVSYAKAFMTAAVWASMDVIAASLSSSDWNVYGGTRGADKKVALPDDQTQFLLNTRANPEMTAQAAKRAICLNAVGGGNGYAEIEWDGAGRFAALWPIEFQRVTPMRNAARQLVYRVQQNTLGGTVDLDPADVFHLRGASLIGTVGDDAIGRAIRSIAMNIAVDEFASMYYANGTNLGGIVTMKRRLDDEAFKEFRTRWNERYRGPRKANSTAFLDGDATYTPLDSDAQKADLTNWKQTIVEEVARWFRVPPHKIGHLLRATNNNIEHQGLEFVRDTLRPWQREIEQESDYKLFSARGQKRFVELDLDWAAQGDYGSRATAYQTLLNTGVFTINDVLRKLGENTIGPAGDARLVQGAMIPLADAGKAQKQVAADPTAPPKRTGGTTEPKPPGGEPKPGPTGMLQTWLATVYARAQRRLDARRGVGRSTAREDAEAHLDEMLGEMRAHLHDAGDDDELTKARAGGHLALDGIEAGEAAARALTTMQETP